MTLRNQRRLAWLVIASASVYLLGWTAFQFKGDDMEKDKETVAGLRTEAEVAIAAKDWPTASGILKRLKEQKPDGRMWACAYRGWILELQGDIAGAKEEYRASYALGNTVAGGTLAHLNKVVK